MKNSDALPLTRDPDGVYRQSGPRDVDALTKLRALPGFVRGVIAVWAGAMACTMTVLAGDLALTFFWPFGEQWIGYAAAAMFLTALAIGIGVVGLMWMLLRVPDPCAL